MTDTCVQIVDGKRGGRNSNVLLNGLDTASVRLTRMALLYSHVEFLAASVH